MGHGSIFPMRRKCGLRKKNVDPKPASDPLLGGFGSTLKCNKDVDNIPVLVHGPPQIMALAPDLDENGTALSNS